MIVIRFYILAPLMIMILFISCNGTAMTAQQESSDTPENHFVPETVFLTWQQDPTTTMSIDWHTVQEGRASVVEYRPAGTSRWMEAEGGYHEFPFSDRTIHRVELTGLQPGTDYRFRFGADSKTYTFRTMPETAERPIRFLAGGDVRGGSPPSEDFIRITRMAAEYDPDFMVMGGDLVYADGSPYRVERWYEFFDVLKESFLGEDNRIVPVIVAMGNHELLRTSRLEADMSLDHFREHYGMEIGDTPYFDALFAFPGVPHYGVLDFGDYMSWIILDSDHANDVVGEQTEWLEQVITERRDRPHIFPIYHVPAWPSVRDSRGSTNVRIRENWVPLFEANNVRVAFENHDHSYKRTWPIRDGRISPEDGIVYIGDGAWGISPRTIASRGDESVFDKWYLKRATAQLNVIIGTVQGNHQHFLMVNDRGEIIDEYPGTIRSEEFPDSRAHTVDELVKAPEFTRPVNEQDSLALVALYHQTDGDNWHNNTGWLEGPVTTWSGRIRISDGRVERFIMDGNNMSGTLPDEMADMDRLERLTMAGNDIRGELPGWIFDLPELERVDFSGNRLTGELPDLDRYPQHLERLVLSGNRITGTLPAALGDLQYLERLELSGNDLEGELLLPFENMKLLERVDLSGNRFSGPVPGGLGALDHRLQHVDLSENKLSGTIPSELGNARFLEELDLSGNRITGEVPETLQNLPYLQQVEL